MECFAGMSLGNDGCIFGKGCKDSPQEQAKKATREEGKMAIASALPCILGMSYTLLLLLWNYKYVSMQATTVIQLWITIEQLKEVCSYLYALFL
jgi:hypothetical protein